jgi:hypothetical protein
LRTFPLFGQLLVRLFYHIIPVQRNHLFLRKPPLRKNQ